MEWWDKLLIRIRSMISNGNPVTYDTCPIIGIGGYGGICDPKGFNDPQWAGCNLPIYGIVPEANITHDGKTYIDRHNPVIWSGYARTWAPYRQTSILTKY